ncbi:MAG: signal peptidase I [Planctomycetes bacterium]|nr:signal peptidase I [Planctomycetota bacterium]
MGAVVAGVWRVFTKAGKPGWGALVPIYNVVLLLEIAKRPLWWLLLLFVPVVNLIVAVIVSVDVAKHFGKGVGFGVGLAFLGFVFYPVLGFSNARYQPA